MIVRKRALARLGLRHGDPVRGGEAVKRLGRLGVVHTAAGHQQWRLGVAQQVRCRRQFGGVRPESELWHLQRHHVDLKKAEIDVHKSKSPRSIVPL